MYKFVSKMVTFGTGQYFEWIEDHNTNKKRIGINLIPVIVSQ